MIVWFIYRTEPPKLGQVDVPEGHYAVTKGIVKPGDLYLNRTAFGAGVIVWEPVGEPKFPNRQAMAYSLLIRPGVRPGGPKATQVCVEWMLWRGKGCFGRCSAGEVICDACLERLKREGATA